MKRASDSRSFPPVKAWLIAIIVSAVTGGFTLGYFVGKGASSPNPVSLIKQPSGETASMPSSGNQPSGLNNAPPAQPGPAESARASETIQASAVAVSNQVLPVRAEPKPETKEETHNKGIPPEIHPAPEKKILYTVQAGAFKHRKEAVTVKHDLDSKGFTASIIRETNNKGVYLFKVRTGEFEDKKEAQIFALKLKKEFGLNSHTMIKK